MEKSAVISIRSFSDLDKDEVIEVVTPGKFHLGESEFKAVYEESEISGMDGTTTTLVIKDDVLVLEREGSTSTRMEFKKGEDVFDFLKMERILECIETCRMTEHLIAFFPKLEEFDPRTTELFKKAIYKMPMPYLTGMTLQYYQSIG